MILQKREKGKKLQTKLWRLWLLMNYKLDTSYETMTRSNSGGGKLRYDLTNKTSKTFLHYRLPNTQGPVSETLLLLGIAQLV